MSLNNSPSPPEKGPPIPSNITPTQSVQSKQHKSSKSIAVIKPNASIHLPASKQPSPERNKSILSNVYMPSNIIIKKELNGSKRISPIRSTILKSKGKESQPSFETKNSYAKFLPEMSAEPVGSVFQLPALSRN